MVGRSVASVVSSVVSKPKSEKIQIKIEVKHVPSMVVASAVVNGSVVLPECVVDRSVDCKLAVVEEPVL